MSVTDEEQLNIFCFVKEENRVFPKDEHTLTRVKT